MVGNNTFSSAIMVATIVKDNHIATLIGQEPANGHPDHFGEMYGSSTPNAKLKLQFGVKEWPVGSAAGESPGAGYCGGFEPGWGVGRIGDVITAIRRMRLLVR